MSIALDFAKEYKLYIAAILAIVIVVCMGIFVYFKYVKSDSKSGDEEKGEKKLSSDSESLLEGNTTEQKKEISQLIDEINAKQ